MMIIFEEQDWREQPTQELNIVTYRTEPRNTKITKNNMKRKRLWQISKIIVSVDDGFLAHAKTQAFGMNKIKLWKHFGLTDETYVNNIMLFAFNEYRSKCRNISYENA